MNTFPNIDDAFGHWLAGFIDGEGCFFADIHPRSHGSTAFMSMTVALRADDGPILYECQERTGLGKVYERHPPSLKNPQTKWEIFRKDDCEQLVGLLKKYPLRAKKARDLDTWAQILDERNNLRTGREAKNDWSPIADLVNKLKTDRVY